MTASRFDPDRPRVARCFAALGLWLCACRAGLPPEPPGHDAADPEASTPAYEPGANPYETSAFEGVELDGAGGHEGMHHGGMKHDPEPKAPEVRR